MFSSAILVIIWLTATVSAVFFQLRRDFFILKAAVADNSVDKTASLIHA